MSTEWPRSGKHSRVLPDGQDIRAISEDEDRKATAISQENQGCQIGREETSHQRSSVFDWLADKLRGICDGLPCRSPEPNTCETSITMKSRLVAQFALNICQLQIAVAHPIT